MQRFLHSKGPFLAFSRQHFSVMIGTILAAVLLPLAAVYRWDEAQRLFVSRGMGALLCLSIFAWMLLRFWEGKFDRKTDLPLDICNLMALGVPFLMWHPSQTTYEILYFLILVGTLQAILTPHLEEQFPHYTFFKYWLVHSGLVIYIIYVTAAFELRPNTESILRAFIAIQVYAITIFLINKQLDSNYFYMMRKPPSPTLLDYFGPWPWYIFVAEFIVLLLSGLVYLPIWLLG
ncbi:MAG: TIGR02206 family membrane protein [Anaerolineales bacterium]|nr:TIGR02206 family membrane protein [Anaerolineales bacterium]